MIVELMNTKFFFGEQLKVLKNMNVNSIQLMQNLLLACKKFTKSDLNIRQINLMQDYLEQILKGFSLLESEIWGLHKAFDQFCSLEPKKALIERIFEHSENSVNQETMMNRKQRSKKIAKPGFEPVKRRLKGKIVN